MSTPGAEHADYAVAIERGHNIVAPLVRRGSGVAVAVGVHGELVWAEGFGHTAAGASGCDPTRGSVVILSNTGGLEQRMALERARDLLIVVFGPER